MMIDPNAKLLAGSRPSRDTVASRNPTKGSGGGERGVLMNRIVSFYLRPEGAEAPVDARSSLGVAHQSGFFKIGRTLLGHSPARLRP